MCDNDTELTLKLGLELFLNVHNVLLNTDYILYNYKNDPNGSSFEWFHDLILNIVKNPVNLMLYGYIGTSTLYNHNEKFVLYIRFVGDNLCTIPLEYYLNNTIPHIHELISKLINPKCELFYEKYTGTEGGITIKRFKYNSILNDIYYPSIYIITLCRRYIELILQAYHGDESCINIIKNVSIILKKAMDLHKSSMIKELYNDIYILYCIIVDSVSCLEIYEKIEIQWTVIGSKADYVYYYYKNHPSYFKRLNDKSNLS